MSYTLDSIDVNFIVYHFALLNANCRLFIKNLSADVLSRRIGELLGYPLTTLRDQLLECIYGLARTNFEVKDAACSTYSFLRVVLGLAIPPSEPYELKVIVAFTPGQKAWVLMWSYRMIHE
jgi:hypothetical protein